MVPDAKYLYEVAIIKMSDKYSRLGYKTERSVKLEDNEVDLIATKDTHKVFFEFKAINVDESKNQQIVKLKKLAQREDAEFKLIIITPRQ